MGISYLPMGKMASVTAPYERCTAPTKPKRRCRQIACSDIIQKYLVLLVHEKILGNICTFKQLFSRKKSFGVPELS